MDVDNGAFKNNLQNCKFDKIFHILESHNVCHKCLCLEICERGREKRLFEFPASDNTMKVNPPTFEYFMLLRYKDDVSWLACHLIRKSYSNVSIDVERKHRSEMTML